MYKLPEISSNYPPEEWINPFDIENDEPQFFISISGNTIPNTLASNNVKWFTNPMNDHFEIPMGYKSLSVMQKLAIIYQGKVLKIWPEAQREKYKRMDQYTRKGAYTFLYSKYVTSKEQLFDTFKEARNTARQKSIEHNDVVIVVTRIIEVIDWH